MARIESRTIITIPGTDQEVALLHKTDEQESDMLFHENIIAYLVHDDDCENPTEGQDGNGKVYSRRRDATAEQRYEANKALGFDSDGQPDFTLLDEKRVVELAHVDIEQDNDKFMKAYEHCVSLINQGFYAPVEGESEADMVKRVLHNINELTPVVNIYNIQMAAWAEGRVNGTIGNKYAVLLDVFEHGQVQYTPSGDVTPCQWDTSRGGAVWVPDDEAIANFEDSSLTYAENFMKARDYARGCVEEYTKWANGDCWGVIVQTLDGVEKEAVWGFIGKDYAEKEMKEMFEQVLPEKKVSVEVPDLEINKILFTNRGREIPKRTRGEQRVIANLIHHLEEKGFKITRLYDGEEMEKPKDMKEALELIFNLDESHLFVRKDGFKEHWIYFVLGNSPEEVVADNSYSEGDPDGFAAAMDEFKAEDFA